MITNKTRPQYLMLCGLLAFSLAACGSGSSGAGDNPGPFGNPGMPGDSNTAGGPTPEIQPGGVSQTAQPPGNQTAAPPTEPVTDSQQTGGSSNTSPTAEGTAVPNTSGETTSATPTAEGTAAPAQPGDSSTPAVTAAADQTSMAPAPTVQPSAVLSTEQINYGVIQVTISQSVVPSITGQILPLRLDSTSVPSNTAPVSDTASSTPGSPVSGTVEPLEPLTGTILTLNGMDQLNRDAATYQQPRIMVMPLESYLPADTTPVTPSLGNPFFDALQLVIEGDNQAIFSAGQLQQTGGLFYLSPALSLRSNVTVALTAEPKQLDFANGKGVRYVSAIVEGQSPITSDNLYYFYHGLTDDRRFYVAAVIPIAYEPLSTSNTAAAAATPDMGTGYDKYAQGVEEQLGSGNDENFNNALANYDRIVSSIRVTP